MGSEMCIRDRCRWPRWSSPGRRGPACSEDGVQLDSRTTGSALAAATVSVAAMELSRTTGSSLELAELPFPGGRRGRPLAAADGVGLGGDSVGLGDVGGREEAHYVHHRFTQNLWILFQSSLESCLGSNGCHFETPHGDWKNPPKSSSRIQFIKGSKGHVEIQPPGG